MTAEVFLALGIGVLLVAVIAIRKIASAVKFILALAILLVGGIGYVIFVPTSEASIWITENIASVIRLDAENKYSTGDSIFEFEFNPSSESPEGTFESDSLTGGMQAATGAINKLLAGRIKAIASKYIELQEEYTLAFSDSYLIMTPEDLSMHIEIIKGALPEE